MSFRIFSLVMLLSSGSVFAASESRQLSGQIESLNDRSVVLRSSGERFEFPRKDLKIPADAKAGDSITVWYKLHAERVEIKRRGQEAGEAGQVAPDPKASPLVDDRAFYPAKNQATPSHPFGRHSRAVNQPFGM